MFPCESLLWTTKTFTSSATFKLTFKSLSISKMAVLEITPFFRRMGSEQEAARGWKEKLFCVSQFVSLSLSSSPFLAVPSHSVRLPRPSLWIRVYLPLSPSFVSFPFRWLCEVFVFHFEHRLFVPPVKSYLTFTPSEITPFLFLFLSLWRKNSNFHSLCIQPRLLPNFLFIPSSRRSRPH